MASFKTCLFVQLTSLHILKLVNWKDSTYLNIQLEGNSGSFVIIKSISVEKLKKFKKKFLKNSNRNKSTQFFESFKSVFSYITKKLTTRTKNLLIPKWLGIWKFIQLYSLQFRVILYWIIDSSQVIRKVRKPLGIQGIVWSSIS